ncbi:hypothetical protein [Cellulomonas flavigena]|uniref:hypothetical protein n=1 Tax=Cellulomonas flavigena TaxID=1711 RepID=UPI000B26A104|nr:hypothetical protein [Cellulomonas flavigena]
MTQQVMAANGDVAMVAGDRNYTHIGDDNSTHVTVAGESGSRRVDSDGDMWLTIGLGFAAFVVIAIFLMRYYEILVGDPRDHFRVLDDDVIADYRPLLAE